MSGSVERKEFVCNISLIKALMQFSPLCDRKRIQEWLTKLQDIDDRTSDSKVRDEYSSYLLINVQNGTLMQPFNKPPPGGTLKPLCRILPDFIYEEVQKQLKISTARVNRMIAASNDNYEVPDLRCDPSNFHCEQPRPRKGVTASFAVFSNYEDGD